MRTPSIKQFKLSNDDELICEVLEWDNEENSAIIVRCPLCIINGEDLDKQMRFYAFKPWMGFSEDPEILHTINASHIIGEVTPSEDLISHYTRTIKKLNAFAKLKKTDIDMEDFADMDSDEIQEYIDYKISERDEEEIEYDEPDEKDGNVITFKPKGTFH